MRNRYTVAEGHEFNYPDADSYKIVLAAGGRQNLSDHDRARVKYKTVIAGQDCGDMPGPTLELYLERGWVIATPLDAPKTPEPVVEVPTEVEEEVENNG